MSTQLSPRTYFNYNDVPDKNTRAVLRQEATAIKAAVKRTHDNIIEIGNRLIHAKEVAGHGNFLEWIDGEFGMSDRHARRFMQVAETFGKSDIMSDLSMPNTALFMLAAPSVSDETRDVAIDLARSGDLKTTGDAKAIIEAAKPPKPAAPEPIAPAHPLPNDSEDFDDSDPFEDEFLQLDTGHFEPEADNENELPSEPIKVADSRPLESPPKAEPATLKERVKNAEVLHDTLATATKPKELSDEDWLESLPIYRVLKLRGHRGIFVKRDLLATRQLLESLDKFEHQARRAFNFKNPSGTPAETRVVHLAAMPRPVDWQVCSPCKGNGCNRCAHSGYDLSGAGISPMRFESGEVAS